jgi:hypothetical protein
MYKRLACVLVNHSGVRELGYGTQNTREKSSQPTIHKSFPLKKLLPAQPVRRVCAIYRRLKELRAAVTRNPACLVVRVRAAQSCVESLGKKGLPIQLAIAPEDIVVVEREPTIGCDIAFDAGPLEDFIVQRAQPGMIR